jgi:hypothetical protein
MAGAAGSGTGAFLRQLSRFVAEIPFERMSPDGGVVRDAVAYALVERGSCYALYLPDGGSVSVDLEGAEGAFQARWFRPVAGEFVEEKRIEGGAVVTLTPPDPGDWGLLLDRPDRHPAAFPVE